MTDADRSRAGSAPQGIDLTRPSAARVYDYYLGGFHNFPVDRDLAEAAITAYPNVRGAARAGRAFLGRAVRHLAAQGVRQFLDLGSGIPTAGNVHEIAQAIDPTSRVAYVDIEPVAVTHGQQILADNPNATSVQADLRDPAQVLALPAVQELIDPAQPTALLLNLALHFIPDADNPTDILRRYRQALGPHSWLALSHGTDEFDPTRFGTASALYARTATPLRFRTRDEIHALLGDYRLVPPGLVLVEQWQPDTIADIPDPQRFGIWAGVARAS